MIKCIATDMDGTLLNSSQEISETNKQAILKAQAQGVEVVVATGRSFQEARFILDQVDLHCPIIGVNGAEVRSKEGDIIATNTMDRQLAKKAAEKLVEHDIYFEVYTNKGTYSTDPEKAVTILIDIVKSANPDVDIEDLKAKAQARVTEGLLFEIEDYDMIFSDEQQEIYKFLAFSFDSERRIKAAESLAELTELAVSSSGHENLEITHRNAQKGIALEAFVNAKGISLAETMAVGDSFNDISMFEKVGRAVAMGNASFEIKAICDVITDSNDDSGLGNAILEVL